MLRGVYYIAFSWCLCAIDASQSCEDLTDDESISQCKATEDNWQSLHSKLEELAEHLKKGAGGVLLQSNEMQNMAHSFLKSQYGIDISMDDLSSCVQSNGPTVNESAKCVLEKVEKKIQMNKMLDRQLEGIGAPRELQGASCVSFVLDDRECPNKWPPCMNKTCKECMFENKCSIEDGNCFSYASASKNTPFHCNGNPLPICCGCTCHSDCPGDNNGCAYGMCVTHALSHPATSANGDNQSSSNCPEDRLRV